ncbi:MAG: hypothetical protein QOK31_1334 [Solirubrobacteraceae bacterium]|jgi:hypothetical protein|nr:hypothetical protein [Solirubrobacteraceae bacterium]
MSFRRLTGLLGALLVLAAVGLPASAAARLGFTRPLFVDGGLAGGEPLVQADLRHHTLVYTSHEGTTHLYRAGLVNPLTFVANYRNQVNIWISRDNGRTWKRDDFSGTAFSTPPQQNQGFSDPDLTQDEGGRIYNTGIDLANDALFSSKDGGVNWDRGTIQCHDGDRPWLAGGRKDQVFMATDVTEGTLSHRIFESTDGGSTCSANGIPDAGSTSDGGNYSGFGKLYYDHHKHQLIEPVVYSGSDGVVNGVGVGTWRRGQPQFHPTRAARTSVFAHWPALALDSKSTVYLVWDTSPRKRGTAGGCDGAETPTPNKIELAISKNFGRTFSRPITIASPRNARALWPWVVAGSAGRASVVWYQSDKLADLDCQPAKIRIFDANISGAGTRHMRISRADVAGRFVHDNGMCQGGTTCVATGQDRRLGDFFTNAVDPRGCVLVASGDTTRPDPLTGAPRPISLPIFMRQNNGTGLYGRECGKPRPKPRCDDPVDHDGDNDLHGRRPPRHHGRLCTGRDRDDHTGG